MVHYALCIENFSITCYVEKKKEREQKFYISTEKENVQTFAKLTIKVN